MLSGSGNSTALLLFSAGLLLEAMEDVKYSSPPEQGNETVTGLMLILSPIGQPFPSSQGSPIPTLCLSLAPPSQSLQIPYIKLLLKCFGLSAPGSYDRTLGGLLFNLA